MIGPDSILRRLPAQLNRKQALFLDGLRHSVEIATFAHSRLQHTLTELVLRQEPGPADPYSYTSAFLDAWALVDAIDRFRSLWKLMPGLILNPGPDNSPSFHELTQPIRDLRNVADHIAQRADYIVARKGTALGILTWCTFLKQDTHVCLSCALVPGTLIWKDVELVNPAGSRFGDSPTGMIHLSAGEHRACLSHVLPEIAIRVSGLEASLEHELTAAGLSGQQAGSDFFIALKFDAVGKDITTISDSDVG